MRTLYGEYMHASNDVADPPDVDLLAPIITIFQALFPPEE